MLDQEYIPKRGRPPKFDPSCLDAVIEAGRQGGFVASFCVAAGCNSRTTFYDWVDRYPEFQEAVEHARLESQHYWEQVIKLGTVGKINGFNATSCLAIMNNAFKQDWQRGSGSIEVHDNKTINNFIGNIKNLTSEEVEAEITRRLQQTPEFLLGHSEDE